MLRETDCPPFRVAFTADFFDDQGAPRYRDMGQGVLDNCPCIEHYALNQHKPILESSQLDGANGVVVLTPAVTSKTVAQAKNLLAIGRFGVGYDAVDVDACTDADVAVFITAGAVDRSVAEATVAWMLAVCHKVREKDILVRTGRWQDRSQYMGSELRNRVFGTVGFGGIARATVELLKGFGMEPPLVYDPYLSAADADERGVRLVSLRELLLNADFVSIHCPLTSESKGLIGLAELALMKPTAYLINTARGGIVDEVGLEIALEQKRIAGAALDCFSTEPLVEPHPLSRFENVTFAPHCIAWTDELFRDIGIMVCQGMIDLAQGRVPHGLVNSKVIQRPTFQAKWKRLRPALRAVLI
jgi:phosphoglycerate dehydrogenase-like enzyme